MEMIMKLGGGFLSGLFGWWLWWDGDNVGIGNNLKFMNVFYVVVGSGIIFVLEFVV